MDPVGRQPAGTYEAESVIRWCEPTKESGSPTEGNLARNWAIRSNQRLKLSWRRRRGSRQQSPTLNDVTSLNEQFFKARTIDGRRSGIDSTPHLKQLGFTIFCEIDFAVHGRYYLIPVSESFKNRILGKIHVWND